MYGTDHRLVQHYQGVLDALAERQATSAAAEQPAGASTAVEDPAEETMYQRLAKRRRRE